MAGLLRIRSYVLHHTLLLGLAGVQHVPPRFRSAEHWLELLRHCLLDGAILSSFSLAKQLPAEKESVWAGISVLPLGSNGLQLVAQSPNIRQVLLQAPTHAATAARVDRSSGVGMEEQPYACQEPPAWLKRAATVSWHHLWCGSWLGSDCCAAIAWSRWWINRHWRSASGCRFLRRCGRPPQRRMLAEVAWACGQGNGDTESASCSQAGLGH